MSASIKFNVVVMTSNGYRALLEVRNKQTFCKRVALRHAKEYSMANNLPARIVDESTPLHELDDFVRGYLTAALWSSTDDNGEPLDAAHDIDGIAMLTVERAHQDCDDFRASNRVMLNRAYKLYASTDRGAEYSPESLAGHDFWLTRNGHGAGFWDRGFKAVGDALSDAAEVYGEVNLYVGDDGKVHA